MKDKAIYANMSHDLEIQVIWPDGNYTQRIQCGQPVKFYTTSETHYAIALEDCPSREPDDYPVLGEITNEEFLRILKFCLIQNDATYRLLQDAK